MNHRPLEQALVAFLCDIATEIDAQGPFELKISAVVHKGRANIRYSLGSNDGNNYYSAVDKRALGTSKPFHCLNFQNPTKLSENALRT